MRALDLVHRWAGGLIGVFLALLGLSGALLSQKALWIGAPGVREDHPPTVEEAASALSRIVSPRHAPAYVVLPGQGFGLYRVGFDGEAGAYADRAGSFIAQWDSRWDRPELWLFDFHYHLFAGKMGEYVAGGLALAGLGFVLSGVVLWTRTWRKFSLRLWPARASPTAVAQHHRDLGVVVAPFLAMSFVTGAMMTLPPFADAVLAMVSPPKVMDRAAAPPAQHGGPIAAAPDWRKMLVVAKDAFPDAAPRMVALPDKDGDLIAMRLKQPAEWHPNGRTMAWFDPATGALLETRDALALPTGLQVFHGVYPLHAGMAGGHLIRILTTTAGAALAILGGFATWSFWIRRLPRQMRTHGGGPSRRSSPPDLRAG